MQKVMIVDDETLFRESMKAMIPWELYEFKICCEARNGIEALELVRKHRPDISLVDINMPFMDGLQLTEALTKEFPDMAIVLVTGHSEFEYARKAVKLGVEDYILKPFSKEELTLTLLKLQEHILKTQEERLTQQMNRALLRERVLNRLITGEYQEDESGVRQMLEKFGIPSHSCCFRVACIEIDNIDVNVKKFSDKQLWKFAITNILSEITNVQGNQWVFEGPEGRLIYILELANDEDDADMKEGFEQLCVLVKKFLKFTITIGVGEVHPLYAGIRTSYEEALHALKNKFILGQDQVILYNAEVTGSDSVVSGFITPETNESLLIQLRKNDWPAVEKLLDAIFIDIQSRKLTIEYVYVICMGLISLSMSYISEQGHPIEDCFGEDFFPYREITKKSTIEETQQWMKQIYHTTMKYMRLHRQTKSTKITEAALKYIESHYHDPGLQLDMIAQHVHINSSYLRALFKKETGTTMNSYITQHRMQKAKELMSSGNIKLSEIALEIGYNDPAYFSKVFKRYFGYSPREYEIITQNK
jgi:two-component system response regulator YesN